MVRNAHGGDASLGMNRSIDRRDFLNGAAVAVGALGTGRPGGARTGEALTWPQDKPGYDPPLLGGMRGSHPGSFEAAHQLRDGDFGSFASGVKETGEVYDLIVVGGGISGLAAAHFYRAARPGARVLIMDNHDDFGGHAKRNEFHLDGKLHLLNGGTLEIDSPRPYSVVADGLLKSLGIDPVALSAACDVDKLYPSLGLGHGFFFDRETFGVDRLVAGVPSRRDELNPSFGPSGSEGQGRLWRDFLAKTPLSAAAGQMLSGSRPDGSTICPG